MKLNIIRIVLIALLFMQMWIIFGFSNQNGEESGSISRKITEIVTQNIKCIQNLKPEDKEITLKKIEHIIRKLAHFTLYTIIGILLMYLMLTYNIKNKNRIFTSLGIGLIYAISDEIHQSFIPNRTPMVGDVVIDFSGVITGILIVFVLSKIVIQKIIKRKDENYEKVF